VVKAIEAIEEREGCGVEDCREKKRRVFIIRRRESNA